jgi:hypothetical protein
MDYPDDIDPQTLAALAQALTTPQSGRDFNEPVRRLLSLSKQHGFVTVQGRTRGQAAPFSERT